MAEGNDFRPNGDITPGPPVDGVSLRESDGRLRVHLEPSPFGTPRRWRRPPAVHLQPGESVRWQANYRFVNSGDGSWYYRLDTLNLGFGPMPTDAFVGRPTHQVTELAYLR